MDLTQYISSGILELYALDQLSPSEKKEVEVLLEQHAELREELSRIEMSVEALAQSYAKPVPHSSKSRLLSTVFRSENDPPVLNRSSSPEDFGSILAKPEMVPPPAYDNIFFVPAGDHQGVQTFVVWMKEGAEPETHTELIEKFLIVEGTCEINVEGKVHELSPGSYLSIPLFAEHFVKVTSSTPCKIVLQRIAA